MSLIDEALKRARQEAAQQDAARRGPGPSWTPVPLAPVRARRSPATAIVAVAAALVLAAVLGWWARRAPAAPAAGATVAERNAAQPAAPAIQPAAPSAQPSAPPAAQPSTDRSRGDASRPVAREDGERPDHAAGSHRNDRTERGQPAAETRIARAEPPSATRPAPDRETPSRRELAAPTTATPAAPVTSRIAAAEPPAPRPRVEEVRPAQPAAAASAAPGAGRSYVREAALPGGRKLELRGIAYSDTQPVVLINGKVLSPGEGVEGYTVVSIQPQRVELKGAQGTLYLTLQ